MRNRLMPTLLVGAVLAVTAGCAGSDDDASGPRSTTTAGSGPGGTVLLAAVGTAEDPDAFTISFTHEDGTKVAQLPAGSYTIKVTDASKLHDFGLEGPAVKMMTSIAGKDDAVWNVDLGAGSYDFFCTPHMSSMHGTFTVV